MAITSTSTFEEARAAYYANRDYDAGTGDVLEFRRAAELLLELVPARTGNRDGEVEMDLSHVRRLLDRANDYVAATRTPAAPPCARPRVKYLAPRRG